MIPGVTLQDSTALIGMLIASVCMTISLSCVIYTSMTERLLPLVRSVLPLVSESTLFIMIFNGAAAYYHGLDNCGPFAREYLVMKPGVRVAWWVFMILMTGLQIWAMWLEHQELLTMFSVGEALEYLPAGVAYMTPTGHVLQANRIMEEINYQLDGSLMMNGLRFWKSAAEKEPVKQLENFPHTEVLNAGTQRNTQDPKAGTDAAGGDAAISDAAKKIGADARADAKRTDSEGIPVADAKNTDPEGFTGADTLYFVGESGRTWMLTRRPITTKIGPMYELLATDVTEERRLMEERRRQALQLKQMNRRLREYQLNVDDTVRREELLAAKLSVHDNLGTALLQAKMYIQNENVPFDGILVYETWMKNLTLLRKEGEDDPENDRIRRLEDAAEHLGINLELMGKMPTHFETAELISIAIQECMTNAVRHAEASQMYVTIRRLRTEYEVHISNNGAPAPWPVKERGGLQLLRKAAQKIGATIEYLNRNHFHLVLWIPLVEDDTGE